MRAKPLAFPRFQISSSAMLLFFVFAIIDPRNKIPKAAQPVLFGLLLTVLCCGFALNSGNAMNPARDLGPRIFSLVVGYGWKVFRFGIRENGHE